MVFIEINNIYLLFYLLDEIFHLMILHYVVANEMVAERRLGPTFNFQLTGPELLR